MTFQKITVFGGASKTINGDYAPEAFRLGELIGQKGATLVFGIGDNGMMGEVFRGALSQNTPIRGITTEKLLDLQCEDPSLFKEGEIEIVPNLSVRKKQMFLEGDVMFILPGGWGTIDEFSEFAVLIQTGEIMKKPLVFINLSGFWSPLKEQLERMYTDGCVNEARLDFVAFADSVEDAFIKAQEIQDKLDAIAS